MRCFCSEVNWTYKNRWYRLITVKAIGFLYPNILDTLSNIFVGSSRRIKTSMHTFSVLTVIINVGMIFRYIQDHTDTDQLFHDGF